MYTFSPSTLVHHEVIDYRDLLKQSNSRNYAALAIFANDYHPLLSNRNVNTGTRENIMKLMPEKYALTVFSISNDLQHKFHCQLFERNRVKNTDI